MQSKHFVKPEGLNSSSSKRDILSDSVSLPSQELVCRLQQILESLVTEKLELDRQNNQERLRYQEQINRRTTLIEQLCQQNKTLRCRLEETLAQLDMVRGSLKFSLSLKQRFESERQSLKSVVSYLQSKNKEMSYQLFELQKAFPTIQEYQSKKKDIFQMMSYQQPKWTRSRLDHQSIYEYTGNFDHDISHNILQKTESMPTLDFHQDRMMQQMNRDASSRKSSLAKLQKKEKSIALKSSPSTDLLQFSMKKSKLAQKRGNTPKNSLSKLSMQPRRKKMGKQKRQDTEEQSLRQIKKVTKK